MHTLRLVIHKDIIQTGNFFTCFSSRDELVSSFNSPGFLGAPFEPAAGTLTSYQLHVVSYQQYIMRKRN